MLSEEGLLGPDVEEVMEEVKKKTTRRLHMETWEVW